ncbi:hypothetical protein M422DRAFT_167568 [Sphaerobolus stellatus SS14]|uniref:Uncharacterized protein n=1 Tax=Sphaerobolus stellatus (strain SS14) TaxID=990650 RepID=A0A0C9VRF3_SPHS4|nr:hypothetical protein M422DRAFT_167568 [Sphaerobolus stellatus SS14]
MTLQAHHAHWKESILGQKIVDVRHWPGKENKVADGISHRWTGFEGACNDGEDFNVEPGWESMYGGVMNNIFSMNHVSTMVNLNERFAQEPYFLEIIEWLEEGQLSANNDN